MGKYRFGLVGKNISYSFSKGYFAKKFHNLGLMDHSYENFDLKDIKKFQDLIANNRDLKGLNVTIPYKEAVIPYLDELDEQSGKIGAVNTIQFTEKGLKGFNTDAYGFQKTLESALPSPYFDKALILGTGGASKAISFVLGELDIDHKFVSRSPDVNQFSYQGLDEKIIQNHHILINCTPLGTYPNVKEKPDIPYEYISSAHLLFDLIYNPETTAFLKEGKKRGAKIINGLHMLEQQADRAWEIWQESW